MPDFRSKTPQQQIDALQGQVLALAYILHAAMDPRGPLARARFVADQDLEEVLTTLLGGQLQDEVMAGVEFVRESVLGAVDQREAMHAGKAALPWIGS